MKAASRLGSAMRGAQARPPSASVSRTTAPASSAEPSAGVGVQRRQHQRLDQPLPERALGSDHLAQPPAALRRAASAASAR